MHRGTSALGGTYRQELRGSLMSKATKSPEGVSSLRRWYSTSDTSLPAHSLGFFFLSCRSPFRRRRDRLVHPDESQTGTQMPSRQFIREHLRAFVWGWLSSQGKDPPEAETWLDSQSQTDRVPGEAGVGARPCQWGERREARVKGEKRLGCQRMERPDRGVDWFD